MLIYEFIRNGENREKFKKELYRYVEYWERIDEYMKHFGDSFTKLYNHYKQDQIEDYEFEDMVRRLFKKRIIPFNGLFSKEFCIEQSNLLDRIKKNVVFRLSRTKNVIDPKNKFSDESIKQNIETAFRSGFYLHFRDIMNKAKKRLVKLSDEKEIANYYFIREFCYGGMFRFNESGDFNVPYGGINYNRKDFRKKVDYIFSDKVRNLLRSAVIENIDFEELIDKNKPNEKDFLFFDPPYDTEFSQYEEHSFTKEDQERLANCISKLKSKFILIIKETDFIKKLYSDRKFKIIPFGKTYNYNIKGRFNRKVRHLIVHNLDVNLERYLKSS